VGVGPRGLTHPCVASPKGAQNFVIQFRRPEVIEATYYA
jgi:hypothetical protein